MQRDKKGRVRKATHVLERELDEVDESRRLGEVNCLCARCSFLRTMILALIVFWVLPLGVVLMSPSRGVEFPGVFSIILERAFTLALIGGISAAYRPEEMASNRQTPETAADPGSDGDACPKQRW